MTWDMNTVTNVANILFLISGGFLLFKGKSNIVQKIEAFLQGSQSVLQTAEILPLPAPIKTVLDSVDEAIRAAETGVRYAEQLYKNDPTIDRKAIATEYAANIFKELGIEITPRLAAIIDGAIEAAVLFLPPAPQPQPAPTPEPVPTPEPTPATQQEPVPTPQA